MTPSLIAEARALIARFEAAPPEARPALAAGAAPLAEALRRRAIDLAMSRATEFSPDLPVLHLLAAEVALCALGPADPRLAGFEADVAGLANFERTAPLAAEYAAFKARHAARRPLTER